MMCNEVNLIVVDDLCCMERPRTKGLLNSSHGQVYFDAETGEVLEIDIENCGCEECKAVVPIHVEVDEWARVYNVGDEDIAAPNGHDILDFDVWMMVEDAIGEFITTTGIPCEPIREEHEESWRQEYRQEVADRDDDDIRSNGPRFGRR